MIETNVTHALQYIQLQVGLIYKPFCKYKRGNSITFIEYVFNEMLTLIITATSGSLSEKNMLPNNLSLVNTHYINKGIVFEITFEK